MALRLAWLICTWTVLGTRPSLPFFTFYFFIFIILFIYIIYFIIFYSLLFLIISLGMDPKCLLTSTDLQTRRARCQHQLSFLLVYSKLFGLYCAATILVCPASCKWWLEQPQSFQPVGRHVSQCGSSCSISVPRTKFVRIPVPKIWLILGYGVKRPGDLDLWPSEF